MYKYTYDWFNQNVEYWDEIVEKIRPRKILEIGSFEGRSACYFMKNCSRHHSIDLYCVDTWAGSEEHKNMDVLSELETNFDHNISYCAKTELSNPVVFYKLKGTSHFHLSKLISDNNRNFDLIYIDGSHKAPDVLFDGCLAFSLLRLGGVMVFDDYKWMGYAPENPIENPKLGVDSFMACYENRVRSMAEPGTYQMYLEKIAE
jgi:predicted O-methyltransferase YrrM